LLDGLLLNHAANEAMNYAATGTVAASSNNNAVITAYTKQIPVKAAAGRPTVNDVDKVHCECGGTHLSPHTTKGAASWRNHVLTKQHQKFLQHQQLQQQLQQQQAAAEQDEDEHEYSQSDMTEELAANAVPVTSFSIGPNSNDSGDGNSLYTGEPV
jgi:hypothetical protein